MRIIPLLESFHKLLHPSRRLSSHWSAQISEGGMVSQINEIRVVICQNPRKDRVLHKVIVRPPCQCVQVHQVLEVGDFSSLRNIFLKNSCKVCLMMSFALTTHLWVTDVSPIKLEKIPELCSTLADLRCPATDCFASVPESDKFPDTEVNFEYTTFLTFLGKARR